MKDVLREQVAEQFRLHILNTLNQAKSMLAQARAVKSQLAAIRHLLGIDVDARVRFEKGRLVVESIVYFDLGSSEGRRSCLVAAEVFSKVFGVEFDKVARECEPPESKRVEVEGG